MQQAMLTRSAAGRAGSRPATTKGSENARAAVDAAISRRSLLLGLAAGVASFASSTSGAHAARPVLSDLVRPLAQQMDENGDGQLDVDEIRGAMQRNGGIMVPRETVVQEVMAPVDFNDDAVLSVDEFARGMALELEVDERWMRTVDRDGVAGVTLEELSEGLGDLGPRGRDVLPAAFRMADKDRKGRLSQQEAQNAMDLIAAAIMGDLNEQGYDQ